MEESVETWRLDDVGENYIPGEDRQTDGSDGDELVTC
jgi:hypothetical protein